MSITINLRIMRGPTDIAKETHTVNLTDTVLSLKQVVATTHGFSVEIQNLHCNKSIMENSKTFGFYGIVEGELLYDLLMGA